MVEILIGVISGIVSAMGMGGGTILILCLTIFLNMEQHIAQASNLVFFIPTSLIAIFMNWKNKLIDYQLGITIVIPGVIRSFSWFLYFYENGFFDVKKIFWCLYRDHCSS